MPEYAKIMKFNPNHDPKNGQFSSGGGFKGHLKEGAGMDYLRKKIADDEAADKWMVSAISAFKVGDQRYKIEYMPHTYEGNGRVEHYPNVTVTTMEGNTVASAQFVRRNAPMGENGHLDQSKGDIMAHSTNVAEGHRRRGIATTMYQFAEMMSGKKIIPDVIQTDDGKAFSKARLGDK